MIERLGQDTRLDESCQGRVARPASTNSGVLELVTKVVLAVSLLFVIGLLIGHLGSRPSVVGGAISAPPSLAFSVPRTRIGDFEQCQSVQTSLPQGLDPAAVDCSVGGVPSGKDIEITCERDLKPTGDRPENRVNWSVCLEVPPCCGFYESKETQGSFVAFVPRNVDYKVATKCTRVTFSVSDNKLACRTRRVFGLLGLTCAGSVTWFKRRKLKAVLSTNLGCAVSTALGVCTVFVLAIWFMISASFEAPKPIDDRICSRDAPLSAGPKSASQPTPVDPPQRRTKERGTSGAVDLESGARDKRATRPSSESGLRPAKKGAKKTGVTYTR